MINRNAHLAYPLKGRLPVGEVVLVRVVPENDTAVRAVYST
jgi:hypothetical protein